MSDQSLITLTAETALMRGESDYTKLLFSRFADSVDNKIQNDLISELMARYSDISAQLAEKNKQLNIYNEKLESMVEVKVKEISDSQIATIHALVKAAEARDDDTGAHIERTSLYCRLLAEKLRNTPSYEKAIDDKYIENLETAAPLHDIGKIAIPDAILLKPGSFTPDEYEIMKTHVLRGYDTLSTINKQYRENAFIKMGIAIARFHHEKWDGTGYMDGLSGRDIPLSARIMALSDVYDAIRSKRVYKEAMPHDKAVEIISEGSGKHFDPEIVCVFLENHEKFREISERLAG